MSVYVVKMLPSILGNLVQIQFSASVNIMYKLHSSGVVKIFNYDPDYSKYVYFEKETLILTTDSWIPARNLVPGQIILERMEESQSNDDFVI